MSSTNKTSLGFNKWVETDKAITEDFNADNALADDLITREAQRTHKLEAKFAQLEGRLGAQPSQNLLINGNFDIWQRGTSQTASGYGSDDRWANNFTSSTVAHSRQAFVVGQTEVPNNPAYFSHTQITATAGANSHVSKVYKFEDASRFSNCELAYSFWAKADANRDIAVSFYQNFGGGGSSEVNDIGVQRFSLTPSWKLFKGAAKIPSVSGKTVAGESFLGMVIWFSAGADFNYRTSNLPTQTGVFDVAQAQCVFGGQVPDFVPRSIGEELALCQRYFEKSYNIELPVKTQGQYPGRLFFYKLPDYTTRMYGYGSFKATKRTNPTVILYAGDGTPNSLSVYNSDAPSLTVLGITTNQSGIMMAQTTTAPFATVTYSGHWTADAEL